MASYSLSRLGSWKVEEHEIRLEIPGEGKVGGYCPTELSSMCTIHIFVTLEFV
jgi:hypothetical protein